MVSHVPGFGGHEAHDEAQLVGAVDHVVHVLEELLIGPGRVAVYEWDAPMSDEFPSGCCWLRPQIT